jgi:hypothetical protein
MASRSWLTQGALVELAAPLDDAGLAGSYFRAVVTQRELCQGKVGSVDVNVSPLDSCPCPPS